jgi:hypothetical protein
MKKTKNRLSAAILSLLVFSFGLVMITSCEEDENKVDPLVGTYAFVSATLAENLMYQDELIAPAGTNVYLVIGQGMFGNSPCDNVLNSAVELRKNNEIYFVCIGEANELKAGTWSINDERSILTLNLSPPAVAEALALLVTNLDEGKTSFSGTIDNLPVPSELFQLPPGGVLLLKVNIQFNKLS